MSAMIARARMTVSALALAAVVLAGPAAVAAEAEKKAEVEKRAQMSEAEREQKLEAARKRLDAAAREIAELSMSMSEDFMPDVRWFVARAPKAMLGINLGAPRKGSEEGVDVVSVSPGGAAAEAGLKAGDVLVEVNGKSLKREGGESPREKLLNEMSDVSPGEKVVVGYRRDGKVAKATLTAQPPADRVFKTFNQRPLPPLPSLPTVGTVGFAAPFAFGAVEGVFGSAELVPLTPKLGQYFGTDKGLLVVRAPNDSRLKLEDGDVIVDIDGRTPSSSIHALRILSSYQAGEKLKLNVLRAKKKLSFDVTIPEDAWEHRIEGARFDGARFMPHEDVLLNAPSISIEAVPAIPGPGRAVPAPPAAVTIAVGEPTDEPI